MHQHKCSLCGTFWQHGEKWDNSIRAHECPACGCHQFRLFKERPSTPQTALTEPQLLAALASAENFVRSTAIFSLDVSSVEAETIVPKLAEMANEDREPMVRLAAVETLRRFGHKARTAVPALARGLQDVRVEVRRAAALALGDLGTGSKSAGAALTVGLSDAHPRVREAAALALRQLFACSDRESV
jgi:HEAT repeat protein